MATPTKTDHPPTYQPKDAVGAAIKGTMITGAAGTFVSAVQNSLVKTNVGAWGIFTRTGGTIAIFGMDFLGGHCRGCADVDAAAMGGTFEFVKLASANLREKDDSWNHTIGGFFAGSILGLRCESPSEASDAGSRSSVRTMPTVLGLGAMAAVILGTFDYTGGMLQGYSRDPEMDEFERKQWLRKGRRRRPIQETIDELGEGRGMPVASAPFHACHG